MAGEADVREFLVTIFNAKICVQNIINITFFTKWQHKKMLHSSLQTSEFLNRYHLENNSLKNHLKISLNT